MEDNSVEKNIYTGGLNLIKKLNLFTALQALWLLEIYYLGINSIFSFVLSSDQDFIKQIPEIVLEYNKAILTYFEDYSELIMFISIAVFTCGIAYAFISILPIFGKYILINTYSGYGISCGGWLFTIYGTYELYLRLGIGVLLTPVIVFMILEAIKRIMKYAEDKTGIKFPEMFTR